MLQRLLERTKRERGLSPTLSHRHGLYVVAILVALVSLVNLKVFISENLSFTTDSDKKIHSQQEKCKTSKPAVIKLDKKHVWFNHICKAGGGTFNNRLTNKWDIEMNECHPRPCPTRFPRMSDFASDDAIKTDDITSQIGGSFIVVRDPIDRFISAFNWRGELLCHPNKEDKRVPKSYAWDNPEVYCEAHNKKNIEEVQIIFNKYNETINNLAEKLCDDNQEIREEARNDVRQIRTLQDQMHEFLPADWAKNELVYERLIPVVLEPGFDFNLITDEAIEYGLENFNISSKDQIKTRKSYYNDCIKNNENAEKTKEMKHSSANQKSLPFRPRKFLSPAGLECAASYFHRDYEFLEQLLYKACKLEDCVNAIESILERRASLIGDPEVRYSG